MRHPLARPRFARALWGVYCIAGMSLASAVPSRQLSDPAIELAAARALLASHQPGVIVVDSVFALPDEAPPRMSSRTRPAERQRLLLDSLRVLETRGSSDTLRVRISEPQIHGDTASISVTIDGRSSGSGNSRFYETVAFLLQREGSRWVVRRRTLLGES